MLGEGSRPRTYQYVEGGGDNPPFGEDPFQRIIGVHWVEGGLFFVVTIEQTDTSGDINVDLPPTVYQSKGGKDWSDAIAITGIPVYDTRFNLILVNAAVGGMVGKKNVFVLGGLYEYDSLGGDDPRDDHEFLYYSNDCVHWSRTNLPYDYTDPGDPDLDVDTNIIYVMYLPSTQTFYIDTYYLDHIFTRDMWSSTDGKNWTRESSVPFQNEDTGYSASPFVSDFIKLALDNIYDNGLTGVTNHKTGTKLYFSNISGNASPGGGNLQKSGGILRNGVPIAIDDSDFLHLGLCFSNGVFLVSGASSSNVAYRSSDDGVTWEKVLDVPSVGSPTGFYCGTNTAPVAAVVAVGGGVFVSGSFDSTIHYARVPTKDSPQFWQNLGSFDFTPGGGNAGIYAASYAKVNGTPTFLLGGSNDHGQVEGWSGIIMLSNDGLHWINVLTVWEAQSNNATVFNLVWDVNENAFYADVHVYASTVSDFGFRLYRSLDGRTWTRVDIGTPPVFSNDVFHTHCNGKMRGVEDGRYGYDVIHDILMEESSGDSVKITTAFDTTEVPVDVYNNTVAYTGGIWLTAGADKDPSFRGKPAIMTSIDNGRTWTAVLFESSNVDNGDIEVVIGAPIDDFRSSS